MWSFTEYWPWWLGGAAIALVSVGHYRVIGLPCGVSGAFARVVNWRDEAEALRVERRMRANAAALERELEAQARAELARMPEEVRREVKAQLAKAGAERPHAEPLLHPAAFVVFLASLAVGGCLAALGAGKLSLSWDMGTTYAAFFGTGPDMWLALFVGGVLVGFGTRMSGGCTMGHGITGNSCLQPGSFLATAVFFGTAVLFSFILRMLS